MKKKIKNFKSTSVFFLLHNYRYFGNLAFAVLVLVVISLLLSVVSPMLLSGRSIEEIFILFTLVSVMVAGFSLMVTTSFIVIKHRSEIIDWGSYLAIIWLLPYFGVAFYLGGARFLTLLRNRQERKKGSENISV